jgi:hypothetical protein
VLRVLPLPRHNQDFSGLSRFSREARRAGTLRDKRKSTNNYNDDEAQIRSHFTEIGLLVALIGGLVIALGSNRRTSVGLGGLLIAVGLAAALVALHFGVSPTGTAISRPPAKSIRLSLSPCSSERLAENNIHACERFDLLDYSACDAPSSSPAGPN